MVWCGNLVRVGLGWFGGMRGMGKGAMEADQLWYPQPGLGLGLGVLVARVLSFYF